MMGEIQNFSKQIGFNDLTYCFVNKNTAKYFIALKGPLSFINNIKDGNVKLEKWKENQEEFKLDLYEIVRGRYKSKKRESALKHLKIIYERQIHGEESLRGEGLKILTPRKCLKDC